MKISEERFKEAQGDDMGYCKHCDDITTSGVEPDADGYDCEQCARPEVMGIENALVYEYIEVIEDDADEDDDIGIISFGDDSEDI